MRAASTLILIALGAVLMATPAPALQTLPFCDKIKDAGERMACLQAHISNLEETLLALSNQIVDLRNALKQKIDADTPYKIFFKRNTKCLGLDDQQPAMVSCTDPDAWQLIDRTKTPGKKKKPKPDSAKK